MFDATLRSEALKRTETAASVHLAGTQGLPRSVGAVRIVFLGVGERTALAGLHQSGCMRARLPKVYGDEPKTAVLINTAGGLTGGDRVSTDIEWREGADACLTTQAAERAYRSSAGEALITNSLRVEADCTAEWLPQEMILFEGGRFVRRTEVDLSDGARFLAIESMVLGRKAMGETITTGLIDDGWRIRRNGRLVLRDSFRLDGDFAGHAGSPTRLNGNAAYANIFAQSPDIAPILQAIRDIAGKAGGASAIRGLVVGRLIAADGDTLRGIMARLIPALRRAVSGRADRLPRVFQI